MTPVHHAIDYVEITVTDMDAAQHFYGTAFGWRFTDYAPAYAGIQTPKGDGEVGGLSLGQNVEPGGPLVLLYSDDLDATVAAVKDAGGTIAEEPYAFPGGRRFTFFDPAGTGSAHGARPRRHAGSGGATSENADPSAPQFVLLQAPRCRPFYDDQMATCLEEWRRPPDRER